MFTSPRSLLLVQVGNPYYVSPEVLRGTGHSYASDVWSLGCLLYELAALRGPFERKGSSLPEVFKRVTAGEYPQLPEGRFTAALEGVVADALTVSEAAGCHCCCMRGSAYQCDMESLCYNSYTTVLSYQMTISQPVHANTYHLAPFHPRLAPRWTHRSE